MPQQGCADKLHLLHKQHVMTISTDDDRLLKSVGASAACAETTACAQTPFAGNLD
jgi:hypothetical protein